MAGAPRSPTSALEARFSSAMRARPPDCRRDRGPSAAARSPRRPFWYSRRPVIGEFLGRKEKEGRKEGRREGRKEGRKEERKE